MKHTLIGIFLLMWANHYDSCDGQLARLTGKKNTLGTYAGRICRRFMVLHHLCGHLLALDEPTLAFGDRCGKRHDLEHLYLDIGHFLRNRLS